MRQAKGANFRQMYRETNQRFRPSFKMNHFHSQIVTSKSVFLLLPILALGNHRESHKITRKRRDQPLSSDDYEEPEIVEKSESTALVRMTRSGYLPPKPEWPPEKQAKWKQYMAALGRYPGKNPTFR